METPGFSSLPGSARVWTYLATAPISDEVAVPLLHSLEGFFTRWQSHGRKVEAGATLVEGRFLVVAAHVPSGDISGCGIDAAVHEIERLGAENGISWASGLDVAFRNGDGEIEITTRVGFRALAQAGEVGPETPVFDLNVATLDAFRTQGIERTAGSSWHTRLLSHVASTP